MRERIAKVQNLLEKNNLDAFLFSSQPNVFYLSGFRSSHAYVVVSRHSYHLLTDGRYYQKAKEELKDWDVILLEGNVLKAIERLLKKIGAFKVGYEEDRVSCEFRRRLKGGLRWVGKAGFLKHMRAIKDSTELRSLIVSEFFKSGAMGESFPAIVASGKGSAIPHWETSTRPIKHGQPLLIDMGLLWKGYCTDFTRTIHLGRASSEFKKIYNIVKDAHLFALEKVKVGRKISEIDKTARDYIKKKGYGKFFIHSTGHGVGIEIHEFPRVYYKGVDKDVIIEEGMVFTIEPGIYLGGKFGVRLENIVAVIRGVGEPLSKVSLDLIEI